MKTRLSSLRSSGLPETVRRLQVFVTDTQKGMQESGIVAVEGGSAKVALPATSFVSLFGKP